MSWLKSVTADTVVVHTRDGRSIRGDLVGAYHTEVALAHASLLHSGGEDQLDGDVIVLRDNVSSPGTRQPHIPLRCGIRLYGIKAPLTRRSRRVALIYAVQNFAQLDDISSSTVLFQNTRTISRLAVLRCSGVTDVCITLTPCLSFQKMRRAWKTAWQAVFQALLIGDLWGGSFRRAASRE